MTIYDEGATDERLLVWNFPDLIYENFDGHEDFMVASPGDIGWQYIDGDCMETGGFTVTTWPNAFAPMSFMIFNPETTEPPLTNDYTMRAYSGTKFLTSFAAYPGPNDDWFISPRLYFTQDFKFSFYGKSWQTYGAHETIQVGYSLTGVEKEDFIWISETFEVDGWWTRYSFDIPKEAKYVAIHHISEAKYILLIDEVKIGLPSAVNAPQQTAIARAKAPSLYGAYEVYLNGEKVNETDGTTHLFSSLPNGDHVAGVKASYTSGVTEMSTVAFSINSTGVEKNESSLVRVYTIANILYIEGEYENLALISITGQKMAIDVMVHQALTLIIILSETSL